MNKTDEFKNAVQKLSVYNEHYAANPENWCVVHATKYPPLLHKDGTMFIPSTAMATNFEIPRTTVHTTFNHVVTKHMMGSWDDMPIVILTSYNDLVKLNGNPVQISAMDTYWSVKSEHGLVLPNSTYIIKPSNDVLFSINEHGATYKRDNYTEEEVETILKMLDKSDRENFEKYQNADFQDYEIEHEFFVDDRVKKMYNSAKDKRAFLRGLFEESRFDILSHYLRNAVVNIAMEKMGFYKIQSIYDCSTTSSVIADTAINMGIDATPSNKGHSNSLYADMENVWGNITSIHKGGIFDKYGIINAPDLQSLFGYITSKLDNNVIQEIVKSFIENKKLDFVSLYEKSFMRLINTKIQYCNSYIESLNNDLLDIKSYNISDDEKEQRRIETLQKQQEITKYLKQLSSIKKMYDFDPNLSEVMHKNAALLSHEYETRRQELVLLPGYKEFITNLQNQLTKSVELSSIKKTRS